MCAWSVRDQTGWRRSRSTGAAAGRLGRCVRAVTVGVAEFRAVGRRLLVDKLDTRRRGGLLVDDVVLVGGVFGLVCRPPARRWPAAWFVFAGRACLRTVGVLAVFTGRRQPVVVVVVGVGGSNPVFHGSVAGLRSCGDKS